MSALLSCSKVVQDDRVAGNADMTTFNLYLSVVLDVQIDTAYLPWSSVMSAFNPFCNAAATERGLATTRTNSGHFDPMLRSALS